MLSKYDYDDFQISLTKRADGAFDLVTTSNTRVPADGSAAVPMPSQREVFHLPLSLAELEDAVKSMSVARSGGHAATATRETEDIVTREPPDAMALGKALADALFAGGVEQAYAAAQAVSDDAERPLRLTLSLAGAPDLLSLPWEFLYRAPLFLAGAARTTVVRRLDDGKRPRPPKATSVVRILGVISSPANQAKLNVEREKQQITDAVQPMVASGRLVLDWLDNATLSTLQTKLAENEYHILHYVGHGSFTSGNESAIYLENDAGEAVDVDPQRFAQLLADETGIRLIVLNSCQGARTALNDPYAGVATTLIKLGVPAVVAMQFKISDEAAIVFATELYTNLISRSFPIDAAVAEARKAIFMQVDSKHKGDPEFATPVLFLRDPAVPLFNIEPTLPIETPKPAEKPKPSETPNSHRARLILGVVAATVVVVFGGLWLLGRNDPLATTPLVTTPLATTPLVTTPAGAGAVPQSSALPETAPSSADTDSVITSSGTGLPRAHTGTLSAQILEPDGDTHLYPLSNTLFPIADKDNVITSKAGVTDSQAAWDPYTNRVAFTRQRAAAGEGLSIKYVVPKGDGETTNGKEVADLIPWVPGQYHHFPAWTADGRLLYAETVGCAPAVNCAEELLSAEFDTSIDAAGYLDTLTFRSDTAGARVEHRFAGMTAIAAHPTDVNVVVVADSQGMWLINGDETTLFAPGVATNSVTFALDGELIVAIDDTNLEQAFAVYSRIGELLSIEPATAQFAYCDARFGTEPGQYLSIVVDSEDSDARSLLAFGVSIQNPGHTWISQGRADTDGKLQFDTCLPDLGFEQFGQAQALAR